MKQTQNYDLHSYIVVDKENGKGPLNCGLKYYSET